MDLRSKKYLQCFVSKFFRICYNLTDLSIYGNYRELFSYNMNWIKMARIRIKMLATVSTAINLFSNKVMVFLNQLHSDHMHNEYPQPLSLIQVAKRLNFTGHHVLLQYLACLILNRVPKYPASVILHCQIVLL